MTTSPQSQIQSSKNVGLYSAIAMSLSGMMGSGLFTVLGYANLTAKSHIPIAFLLAGIAVLFTVYSCAKLSATFPVAGGPAGYIVSTYGNGFIAGWMNIFLYLGFLISTSLYASGFTEFIVVLTGNMFTSFELKLIGGALVFIFALVNLLGASIVGLAGLVAIGLVLISLLAYSAVGISHLDAATLDFGVGPIEGIAIATGMLYINYQGFAVVSSAADSMAEPKKTIPKAMYIAVLFVIALYVLVSFITIQVTPVDIIKSNPSNVIGAAANLLMGKAGFIGIGLIALLSCAAAVNATIFTATKVLGVVVTEHANAAWLTRALGRGQMRRLLVSAAIVIVLVLGFPLEIVGKMASMAFLLLFGVITYGHIRICGQTGANAIVLWFGLVINLALFIFLVLNGIQSNPAGVIVLVIALAATGLIQYRYQCIPKLGRQ
ncbi:MULTISPECIES: APC family permease [unclassified Polynucleobacter]|uniref:APC family permease n=1 Tax=unclassified Polynucleobacter TaxID=2640945 RepID=UPI001BFE6617|nr:MULTISPECIES: APC family permease [unclassified Polynucleobacter]MEA9604036.1 APC family permease [Polynucleobacter sp. JS-JIR-II-c23]QWE03392.1 amino acid permease [Polynucleobacter sp. JS-JIR-II-b4]